MTGKRAAATAAPTKTIMARTNTPGDPVISYKIAPGADTTKPANVPSNVRRAFSGAYPACTPVSSSGSLRAAISGTNAPFVTR